MKRVIGDDGKEYIQWEGQVAVPIRDAAAADLSAAAAYTIEQLQAMKAAISWPNPLLPKLLAESDLPPWMTAKTWLPGDPGPFDGAAPDKPAPRSEPEHPTGRFENLDWEADS